MMENIYCCNTAMNDRNARIIESNGKIELKHPMEKSNRQK
jgi:hypothetical protein